MSTTTTTAKRKRRTSNRGNTAPSAPPITDARFRHVQTDPRFRRAPIAQRKFALDDRFKRMLTDKEFTQTALVDKFGRKHRLDATQQLKRFYRIEDDDDDDATRTAARTTTTTTANDDTDAVMRDEEDDNGDMSDGDAVGDVPLGAYLSERAMAPPSSASDGDEDTNTTAAVAGDDGDGDGDASDSTSLGTDSEASEEETFAIPEDTTATPIRYGPPTHRLALLHLDWDKFTAKDLFILLRSFLPGDHEQRLINVSIYVSAFGKERMAEEAKYGPVGLYTQFGFDEAAYKQRIEEAVTQVAAKQQKQSADVLDHRNQDVAADDADNGADDDLEAIEADEADDEAFGADYDHEKPLNDDGDVSTTDRDEHDDDDNGLSGDFIDDDDDDAAEDDKTTAPSAEPSESTFSQQALRQYELSRLRYYYAIVTCSCTLAASRLYHELDGIEWESSANLLDFRFVPDDVVFDVDDEKDECNEGDVSIETLSAYRAPHFTTRALHHSSVALTWEEGDVVRDRTLKPLSGLGESLGHISGGRKKAAARKSKAERLAEEREEDLALYLASDDSGDGNGSDAAMSHDDEDGGDKVILKKKARAKYSNLLSLVASGDGALDETTGDTGADGDRTVNPADLDGLINHKDRTAAGEFEIKYDPTLRAAANAVVKAVNDRSVREDETAWQKYLRERKEKRRERKAQRAKGKEIAPINDDSLYADDPVDVDLSDPFFADVMDERQTDDIVDVVSKAKDFFNDVAPGKKKDKSLKGGKRAAAMSDPQTQRELAELSLLVDEDKRGYDLNQLIKQHKQSMNGGKKKKKEKVKAASGGSSADSFKVDPNDPRFRALYESTDYAIDPTSAQYKPTAGTEQFLNERIRRRMQDTTAKSSTTTPSLSSARTVAPDNDLNALVANVKRRAQQKPYVAANKKQRLSQ